MGRELLASAAVMDRLPLLVAMVWLLVPRMASASTPPADGAVAKPAAFVVHWPFEAGERIRVSSAYGPNGGSALHAGTNRTSSANDHHALDLVLADHPNNGRGMPVLAIASGTVVRAGWATSGWASYGQRVIVAHDWSGDGHTYVSIYCHLDAVLVEEGQTVAAGTVLGNVGGSSNASPNGVGVHLHFALHQDSEIGGSGTGGSYGGHAVVPEPMDGAEDLVAGTIAVSENDGSEGGQPCALIGPGETILDERGPCFSRSGPSEYWHDEDTGWDGRSVWTFTTDEPDPTNFGVWRLTFEQGGVYDVWAFIPAGFGQSEHAAYRIRHDGQDDAVERRQPDVADDWLALGSFAFAAGGEQSVRLEDDTGESYSGEDSTRIAFDALRFRPPGADAPDAAVGADPDAGPEPDAALPGYEGPSGCSCRTPAPSAGGGPAPWLVAAVLGWLAARRRRA